MNKEISKKILIDSDSMSFSAGVMLPKNYSIVKKIILDLIETELNQESVKDKICSEMNDYKFEIKIECLR